MRPPLARGAASQRRITATGRSAVRATGPAARPDRRTSIRASARRVSRPRVGAARRSEGATRWTSRRHGPGTRFPDQARVVIIGGGVIGASIAYHLTKLGWSRRRAAGAPAADRRNDVARRGPDHLGRAWRTETLLWMTRYTRDLCVTLEAETGQATGFRPIGHLHLATTPQRLETLRREAAFVRGYGVDNQELSAAEFGAPLAGREDRRRAGRVLRARRGPGEPRRPHPGLREGRPHGRRPDHRGRHGHRLHAGERARHRRRHGPGHDPRRVRRQRRRHVGPRGRGDGRRLGAAPGRRALLPDHRHGGLGAPGPARSSRTRTATATTARRAAGSSSACSSRSPAVVAGPASRATSPSRACRRTGTASGRTSTRRWTASRRCTRPAIRTMFCGPESFTPDIDAAAGRGAGAARLLRRGRAELARHPVQRRRRQPHRPVDRGRRAAGRRHRPHRGPDAGRSRRAAASAGTGRSSSSARCSATPPSRTGTRRSARNVRRSVIHDRLAAAGAHFAVSSGWEYPEWFAADGTPPGDAARLGDATPRFALPGGRAPGGPRGRRHARHVAHGQAPRPGPRRRDGAQPGLRERRVGAGRAGSSTRSGSTRRGGIDRRPHRHAPGGGRASSSSSRTSSTAGWRPWIERHTRDGEHVTVTDVTAGTHAAHRPGPALAGAAGRGSRAPTSRTTRSRT